MTTDQQRQIEDARQLCMNPLMRCQWAIEELRKHPGWCFIKLSRARPDVDVINEVIWFGEDSMAQTGPAENAWQIDQFEIRAAAVGRRMKVNVLSEAAA